MTNDNLKSNSASFCPIFIWCYPIECLKLNNHVVKKVKFQPSFSQVKFQELPKILAQVLFSLVMSLNLLFMHRHISGLDSSEAVVRRCPIKKLFLKISQNTRENTCTRVSFLIKMQASDCNFIKKETLTQVLWNDSSFWYCCRSCRQRCSIKNSCFWKFLKIYRKTSAPKPLFNKVVCFRSTILLKKRVWCRCFLVNFVKFLRTLCLQNTSGRLFLPLALSPCLFVWQRSSVS